METHRVRPYGFETFLESSPAYVEAVLAEVRARGPLSADALADPDSVPRSLEHAWFSSVPRAVLEAHFGRGLLAVAERRKDFARVFDLAERVLPPEHYHRKVDRDDAQRELLRLAARSYGVATASDLADYYRMPVKQALPRIAELLEAGELREVRIAEWRTPAYLHREARPPRPIAAQALLSPFDPVVWYRPRTARLFGFEYRIEIFVPAGQRKWGYYVLPFLLGDRLVARVDVKADRAGRVLLVPAAYLEPHADQDSVAGALARELRTLAGWLKLDDVVVGRRGNFARLLRSAVTT
jgi:uncharacterized protein